MAAQLQQALQALYHGSTDVKNQANEWLEHWQQSPEAWQLSHDLLCDPSAGVETHYFCAQTLRTKVQYDFEELPPSVAASLRDSLLSLLVLHGRGPTPVRMQLCLAVAALVAHLPAANWPPSGVVVWLAQRLSSEAQDVFIPCMMELLIVLPQEAGSSQALRPERRRKFHEELLAYVPQALQILSSCLSAAGARSQEQVLEAFTSWLKMTAGVVLDEAGLTSSPLVQAALQGLRSSETFFAATDVVVELIYCTSRRGRPKEGMMQLVQIIVPEVMALRSRFHICLQQALAENAGHERQGAVSEYEHCEEMAKGMARLFAEIGEAYTDLISTGAPEVMAPVEAMLDVASHPDNVICSMSFNFWHRLCRALTVGLHPEPLESEEEAVSDEERQRRVALFTPILERLVALIQGRVRFPDGFDSWHRDERQEFKRSRIAVGDTLIDCAMVLGGTRMLQILVGPLLELSARVSVGAQEFDWRTAEAALYCVRAVHRCAPLPSDTLLMSLFSSLPTLPNQPQLQYTTALTVGAYADWLADTAKQGEEGQQLLHGLLNLLITGLSEPEASSASALSLRRLCDGCAALLGGTAESLMRLYNRIQGSGDVAQNDFEYDLDEDDVLQLIEAVALVVSALPVGTRQPYVQQMLDITAQPLQMILQAAPPAADSQASSSGPTSSLSIVLPLMDRMTTILRAVRDPADVAQALLRLWPWIETALDHFSKDVTAVERICRAPRYAVRSAGRAAAPALPLLVTSLPKQFEATLNPCFLYVASELIKTFGNEPQHDVELGPMFTRMMSGACSGLRSLPEVQARPDVADDMFLLAGRALSYAPRLVMTPQLLPVLLDSALAGVLVQHREACCSILGFVMRLLDPAIHRQCMPEALAHLQAALAPRAPLLVRLLLAGMVGALPVSRQPELTDTLYAVLKAMQAALQWVAENLAAVPEEAASATDKQKFLLACQQAVHEGLSISDVRQLHHAVSELSDVCRRRRQTQQLAQRALLPRELHGVIH